MHIRLSILFLFIALIPSEQFAQVITTDPDLPTSGSAATIYFDATQGNQGLMDFTGDVYAHTGVITENSTSGTDWKFVKTNWGENTAETKLTRISANLYSLNLTPSIREYYGVPETTTIEQMAFVFRSADNSREGKDVGNVDILADVYDEGLNVAIQSPENNMLSDPGIQLTIDVSSSEIANLTLFLNNEQILTLSGDSLSHTFSFNNPGDFWVKVSAATETETDSDSVLIHILDNQVEAPVPGGYQEGINYLNDSTVQLVLHAPGKEYVFVIGDFNHWAPSSKYRMSKDNDRWWISLNDLEPGVEYAYQYLVDGNLLIADPYTEKILDPFNDRWISEDTYPNLIDYPQEYTTGIVSVLQTGQSKYQWNNSDFTAPPQEKLIIYEILLRDFIADHNWKTLTDTLNYISELGVNAIELMPFSEFEGNESWGYNPSFYFALDKYYGTKESLQAFIDSCHGRGIAVIMDMVLNHSYSQSPLVQLYFDNSTYKVTSDNPWYNVESPNDTYSWGYDFNHESMATRNFVTRVNKHWLTDYNLDGFRFDFTKGFTNTPGDGGAYDADRIAILKHMSDEIWKVNPDAYVILEHFAVNAEEKELSNHGMMIWGNSNYNYNEATMGWNDNNKSDFNWISYKSRGWNDPNLVGYMESHDEERLMFKNLLYGNGIGNYQIMELNTALARMELAGAFFFTIPGPKMIWQFGELGYDISIDENGRIGNKPILWDYYDNGKRRRLYQVWSAIMQLKKTEPAFSTDDFILNTTYATKRIELNHADMDVRIIGNFNIIQEEIDPNFSQTGYWYDFFSGDSMQVDDVHGLIELAPGEYRIYTTRRLKEPEITAEVLQYRSSAERLFVYPNPANEFIKIRTLSPIEQIRIFDGSGRIVHQSEYNAYSEAIDISGFTPGVYIIKASYKNGTIGHTKFLVRQ
ncbi:alpha-amylase family glycosyl hydrolase [Bacteroidota bacterium]